MQSPAAQRPAPFPCPRGDGLMVFESSRVFKTEEVRDYYRCEACDASFMETVRRAKGAP